QKQWPPPSKHKPSQASWKHRSKIAFAVQIGLAPTLNHDALKKPASREWVAVDEGLGLFASVDIHNVEAAVSSAAVVLQLGPAGQQQLLLLFQILQMYGP